MWFRTPGTDGRGHNFSHSSFTSTSPSTFLSCLKQIYTLFHSSQLIPSLHLREERAAICKLTLLPCHHSKCRAAHIHRTRTSFRLSRTQATVLKYREAMHGKKRTLSSSLSLRQSGHAFYSLFSHAVTRQPIHPFSPVIPQ